MIRLSGCLIVGLAMLSPSLARASEPAEGLAQALTSLSKTEGFDVEGLDQVGDQVSPSLPKGPAVRVLRKMLHGYSYILEISAADGRLERLNILGGSGDHIEAYLQNSTGDGRPD